MSIKSLTCLISAKIQRCVSYKNTRAISSAQNSLSLRNYHEKAFVVRPCPIILTKHLAPTFEGSRRYKTTGKKNKESEDSDSEDEEETEESNSKVIKMRVSSLRIDLIVKTGMGIARNKAEIALYESKIRVNGEKVLKKSAQVNVGDVIDLIRGPSPKNPNFLIVSRITLLSAVPDNDAIKIKFTKDKSLLIENYEQEWTPVNE